MSEPTPRLLLDSRDPEYRWKLWVRVASAQGNHWHFFWRRLAVVALALLITGWLGLAGAAWGFLRFHREWRDASYLDIALYPLRAGDFRASLAQHYISTGRAEIEAKNYRQGYTLLLAGLARAPQDLDARRTVAIQQVRYGLLPRALDTLAGGIRHQPDLEYLKLLFGWMLEAQQDERVLTLAGEFLPAAPTRMLEHQFVALQAATAHFERGRYDEAERWIADWGLHDALEGQLLLARCDWERGAKSRAIQRLEAELARFGKRDELYLRLIRFHRELGHYAEARRLALLRQFNDPTSPGPRIDLLHSYHSTGDYAAEAREVEAYLAAFGSDERALLLLAEYAVDVTDAALMDRVYGLAREREFPLERFTLTRVQLAVILRHYPQAIAWSDEALREQRRAADEPPSLLEALRAIALFGRGDIANADLAVSGFIERARLRVHEALLLARELRLVGAGSQARALLERTAQFDAFNQGVVAEIVRLDAASGNRGALATHLPRLLAMRAPPRPILEEALLALHPVEDAAVVTQLRQTLAQRE
jgi:hypothetical protein